MSNEYRQKDTIPDLYDILGLTIDVCKEPNCAELIERAYLSKAKVCHPDKYPGRKDVAEVFQLLTDTYSILKNESERSEYNNKLTLVKQSSNDYLKLKKATDAYMKSIGEYIPANDEQKLSFKQQMALMDTKHGFDSSKMDAIKSTDAIHQVKNMEKLRSRQEVDLKPEKLFDGHGFDAVKFNATFDKFHKKNDTEIVLHNGVPSAWNDLGNPMTYSSFDDLGNLYVNDNNRIDVSNQLYGSVDMGEPTVRITKDDIANIEGADYVYGHNNLDDAYYKNIKANLNNRNTETSQYENLRYGNYTNDTAGYGIMDQLETNYDAPLSIEVDESLLDKYNNLLKNYNHGTSKKNSNGR